MIDSLNAAGSTTALALALISACVLRRVKEVDVTKPEPMPSAKGAVKDSTAFATLPKPSESCAPDLSVEFEATAAISSTTPPSTSLSASSCSVSWEVCWSLLTEGGFSFSIWDDRAAAAIRLSSNFLSASEA